MNYFSLKQLLFVFLGGVLLVACQNSQQNPTQPAVSLQPTATQPATFAPTYTSIPTHTSTSTPAVTPTTPATATPVIATPIFTTQGITHTLRPVPLPLPQTVALHPPDSAVLLQVMEYLYQGDFTRIEESFEENQVENVLNRDLELYFANGWPNAEEFATRPVVKNTFVEHGNAPLQKIVNQSLLEHLNSQKVELKNRQVYSTPTFHLILTPVDVLGDGSPQWLVELRNAQTTGMYRGFWAVLHQNSAGEYTFLAENLPFFDIYLAPERTELYQTDVAGTPALDLIIFSSWYMGGTFFDELNIYSWDGEKIVQVGWVELAWGRNIPQPTYDFSQDVTADGRADLQLTFPFKGELNCAGEKKVVYSWPNNSLEPAITETPPAETVECLLWEGIQQQDVILLEKSLALLQNDPTQPADLIALNLIHLSMAYFIDGKEDIAQNRLSQVMALPAEPLTQLVQTAYQQTPAEPLAVCHHIYEQAQQAIDSVLAPQLTELVMLNDPGSSENHIYPPVLCRLEGTINAMLQKQPLLAEQNPISQLQQLGLSVLWSQELQLTDSPTPEWLVVLADLPNSYLTLETITTTWTTTPHILYFDEFVDLEVGEKDVTGDGLVDVVGVLTSAGCDGLEDGVGTRYHVLLLASADPLALHLGEQTDSCGTPAWTVETVTTEQIDLKPLVADWYNVSQLAEAHGFKVDEAHFYAPEKAMEQYLRQLADQILAGSLPAEEIEELLVHMPVDNPAVEPYYAHLLFFLGYYYELNGESDLALDHYLRLINTYPSSVWSWLAWARIN
jgi:hypothetical protein